jgi:hypothetical protein
MTKKSKSVKAPIESKLELVPPWITRFTRYSRGNVAVQSSYLTHPIDFDTSDPDAGKMFLETRSQLHALYIKETEKTKRTGLWLSASLIALACLIPVFAPEGRDVLSYWISAALLVFAAGAMGFTAISLKAWGKSITASSGSENSN